MLLSAQSCARRLYCPADRQASCRANVIKSRSFRSSYTYQGRSVVLADQVDVADGDAETGIIIIVIIIIILVIIFLFIFMPRVQRVR